MANLIRARTNPPFGWHYAWQHLNEDGMLDIKHKSALKQPETTRIRFNVPDTARGNHTREVSANIVPDKGLFGAEFALLYTFPEFEKRIKARLSRTANNYVASLYNLM
eukprot:8719181-Ditylum_brightwellii.AAC.1